MITGVAKNRSWIWVLVWTLLAAALVVIGFLGYWWWKTTTATVSSCQPKDLNLSVSQDAQLNSVSYVHAILTNNGSSACTLNGYPTVTMLNDKGARVGSSDAQYSDAFAPATVTLQPNGGQAYALLGFPDVGSFSSGVCSDSSSTVRLYLPGTVISPSAQALTAQLQKNVCPGFTVAVFQSGS